MKNRKFSQPCLLLAALLIVGCSDNTPPAESIVEGPATFVGSSACQGCHAPEFDNWLGSHHQLAMHEIDNAHDPEDHGHSQSDQRIKSAD